MLSYHDVMAVDPASFRAVAALLRRAYHALGTAAHTFTGSVLTPLTHGRDWRAPAAGPATRTAEVHRHSLSIAVRELTAAARTLELFADDVSRLQALLRRATSAAWSDGAAVAGDGSIHLTTSVTVAGNPQRLDEATLARRQSAAHTYTGQRDAILRLATEIDAGCRDILRAVAAAVGEVLLDDGNQQLNADWKSKPHDLDRLELLLNVRSDPSVDRGFNEYAAICTQLMTYLGMAGTVGNKVRTSVNNARKFLASNGDPVARATAQQVIEQWRRLDSYHSPTATAFMSKAAPVVGLLFEVAKYSAETKSVVEIGVKSGLATGGALLGGLVGTGLTAGLCGSANLPDGEVGFPICAAGATILGSFGGASLGGKAGTKLGSLLYHKADATPDPFLVQYRTTGRKAGAG